MKFIERYKGYFTGKLLYKKNYQFNDSKLKETKESLLDEAHKVAASSLLFYYDQLESYEGFLKKSNILKKNELNCVAIGKNEEEYNVWVWFDKKQCECRFTITDEGLNDIKIQPSSFVSGSLEINNDAYNATGLMCLIPVELLKTSVLFNSLEITFRDLISNIEAQPLLEGELDGDPYIEPISQALIDFVGGLSPVLTNWWPMG